MIRKEINTNGTITFFNELNQIHNEDDLPAVIYKNGNLAYCKNGEYHRIGGPAVIHNGICVYWIHGIEYTKEEFDMHPLVREYRLKQTIENLLKQ